MTENDDWKTAFEKLLADNPNAADYEELRHDDGITFGHIRAAIAAEMPWPTVTTVGHRTIIRYPSWSDEQLKRFDVWAGDGAIRVHMPYTGDLDGVGDPPLTPAQQAELTDRSGLDGYATDIALPTEIAHTLILPAHPAAPGVKVVNCGPSEEELAEFDRLGIRIGVDGDRPSNPGVMTNFSGEFGYGQSRQLYPQMRVYKGRKTLADLVRAWQEARLAAANLNFSDPEYSTRLNALHEAQSALATVDIAEDDE